MEITKNEIKSLAGGGGQEIDLLIYRAAFTGLTTDKRLTYQSFFSFIRTTTTVPCCR